MKRDERIKVKKIAACPISHGACRFCSLYRARHCYIFPACKEYLSRLRKVPISRVE